jgi:hypothetical protein
VPLTECKGQTKGTEFETQELKTLQVPWRHAWTLSGQQNAHTFIQAQAHPFLRRSVAQRHE